MVSLRAAGACAACRRCPLSVCRAWMGAHHDPRAGEERAPPGGRVPRPSRAPHRFPGVCRAGKTYAPIVTALQHGFDSLEDANTANPTTLANGVESAELANVKDSEKHADRPPKALGAASGLFWGRVSPGPPTVMGAEARGLLARPTGGPMKGSSPEAHVR